MALKDTIDTLVADGQLVHEFVRGAKDQTINTTGGPIPTLAGIADKAEAAIVSSTSATTTNSLSFVLGAKVMTVLPNKGFKPGQWVTIGNAHGSMIGTVVSYADTTLEVDVKHVNGSGSYTAWNISLSAAPGKDAYLLALESGIFNGTRIEWLESLKGSGSGGGSGRLIVKMPWEL